MNISERLINISSIPIIMNQKLSRREFIKGTAKGLIGLIGLYYAGKALSGCGTEDRVDWEDEINGYYVKYSKENPTAGTFTEQMEIYKDNNPVKTITLTQTQYEDVGTSSIQKEYDCEEHLPESKWVHGKIHNVTNSTCKEYYWVEQSGKRHYSSEENSDILI
jgi:hypothetical protein